MRRSLLLLITFLSTTSLVFAENHLLILGGGGEPKGETTIFDDGMNKLGKYVKKSNSKYDVSFNGGHSSTERILQKQFSKGITPTSDFTKENFIKKIKDYEDDILNGKIKPGDQLIIIINTHGAQKIGNERTHYVAVSGDAAVDLNNLSGSPIINLDRLDELVNLTNKRGINLGIVDLSCHSGNTLALKKNTTNTCVITSTGSDHYSYLSKRSFNTNFMANLRPGQSLEEAFLNARLNSIEPEFPMISTNENNNIVSNIYAGITPYLNFSAPNNNKLSSNILKITELSELCKREDDFNKLIKQIDSLQSVLNAENNSFNVQILKNLLLDYKKDQDDILKTIKAMGAYNLDKVESFPFEGDETIEYSWSDLLEFDVDENVNEIKDYLKQEPLITEEEKSDAQLTLNHLEKVKAKQNQILAENPKLKTYKTHADLLIKTMKDTYPKARNISMQEKKLYEELYRRNQNINLNDPCKKIKL